MTYVGPWTLTTLQSGIAACLLDGLTYRQTAQALGRNETTTRRNVMKLRAKLGAYNRRQLVERLAGDCLPACITTVCHASPDGFCDA